MNSKPFSLYLCIVKKLSKMEKSLLIYTGLLKPSRKITGIFNRIAK